MAALSKPQPLRLRQTVVHYILKDLGYDLAVIKTKINLNLQ
jgi:hypothetical protein